MSVPVEPTLALGAAPGSLHDRFPDVLVDVEARYTEFVAAARDASRRAKALRSKPAKALDSAVSAQRLQAKQGIAKLHKQLAHSGRRSYAAPPGWMVGFLALEASGYVNQVINWLEVFAEVETMESLPSRRAGWVLRKKAMPPAERESVESSVSASRTALEQTVALIEDVREGRAPFGFGASDGGGDGAVVGDDAVAAADAAGGDDAADGSVLQIALANADMRTAMAAKWVATAEFSVASPEAFAADTRAGEGARALELSFVLLDSSLDTAALMLDTLEMRLALDERGLFDKSP